MADYWAPKRLAVQGRVRDGYPGERVWARIKVYDHAGQVLRGASEPFRLDLKPSTSLLGLKSFNLNSDQDNNAKPLAVLIHCDTRG